MTGTNSHIRALAKGLAVLELLATESRGLTLAELAQRLGFNRSTTHQLLATLRERGFVDQEPQTKAYRLGYRLVGLVNEFVSEADISSLGIGPVQELCDATGDTYFLTILQGWELFVVFQAAGTQPIHTARPKQPRQTHLHATASGKMLLAHLPTDQADTLLATAELDRMTPNTITSVPELRQELAAIREQDYALDREEFLTGVASIAVPVFDRSGICVATVSVVYPAFQAKRREELMPLVVNAAHRISLSLGFVPDRQAPARGGFVA